MKDIDEARQDYQSLRSSLASLHIASIAADHSPLSSYAPFVWYRNACYLLLSDLAEHTQNLKHNPAVSLMMIESESEARNPFARRRILLQGSAKIIPRQADLYAQVISLFQDRFGEIIEVIASLQDFHLFQVLPRSGRFIRGFGKAYQLTGDNLDELIHINPAK